MFEFFEGLIEKIGVRLVSDFSEKLIDFIRDVKQNSNSENNDNGGYSAKIGSSGYSAQIGSSGDYAQIGSSGDMSKIGSSGYYAQIGSSGDMSKIGSSGYGAKIGSSGDSAQIGSSGDYAQIGTSGYSAQVGSSGDNAQIHINGDNSVGFACGYKAIIKAKKGTWISLCEYEQDENDNYIPSFAISVQIGNKDYKDFKGRILKETEYYTLHNKQLYPVDISDNIKTIKISEKKREGITIIKALDLYDTDEEIYIVKEKDLSAHEETLKEAMEDLIYKKTQNEEIENIISEIKKTGKVNRAQYRAITGACQYGTNKFCEEHNIQDLEEISLKELRKILINDYGAEKFWNLIDKEV